MTTQGPSDQFHMDVSQQAGINDWQQQETDEKVTLTGTFRHGDKTYKVTVSLDKSGIPPGQLNNIIGQMKAQLQGAAADKLAALSGHTVTKPLDGDRFTLVDQGAAPASSAIQQSLEHINDIFSEIFPTQQRPPTSPEITEMEEEEEPVQPPLLRGPIPPQSQHEPPQPQHVGPPPAGTSNPDLKQGWISILSSSTNPQTSEQQNIVDELANLAGYCHEEFSTGNPKINDDYGYQEATTRLRQKIGQLQNTPENRAFLQNLVDAMSPNWEGDPPWGQPLHQSLQSMMPQWIR